MIAERVEQFSPAAEIAFEIERPQSLEAFIGFAQRYLDPDEVFSEDRLAGLSKVYELARLEVLVEDLREEVSEAENEADDARSRVDELEDAEVEAGRRIQRLCKALDAEIEAAVVPRGTEEGPA